MRRLTLTLALVIALTAALAACGGSETDGSTTGQATTPAPAASQTAPDTTATPSAPQGAEVYQAQCAGCHDTGGGLAGEDAAKVRAVVESGAEGMPAFSGTLTPAEIEAVSEYVAGGLQ
jgi:mono/diheme cytochrome c family protein